MIFEVLEKINCKEYLKNLGFSRNIFPIIKTNLLNNNKPVRLIDDLDIGVLELKLSDQVSDIVPIDDEINIVYEDDYILILNKPKNLCIMPNYKYYLDNLAGRIINYYNKKNIKSTVHILTRLDRQTRGLVFVVKYKEFCNLFKIDEKKYYAVCSGYVKSQVIEAYMKKDEIGIKRHISSDGDYSKTIINLLEYNKNSLVECNLITGRTHQIRVHLKSINSEVLGDELYGSGDNLLLECYYLRFYHPFLKREMEIKLDLDEEFKKYI